MDNDPHSESFRGKVKFAVDLQKKFSGELGFLPRAALSEYLRRGCVDFAQENGDAAGYVLIRPMRDRTILSIVQAAVCKDAQRRKIGLALVHTAVAARSAGVKMVQAWCAADIEACAFWRAAGFVEVMREDRGNTRGRDMILYRRPLVVVPTADLFRPPERAGYRAVRLAIESAESQGLLFDDPSSTTRRVRRVT